MINSFFLVLFSSSCYCKQYRKRCLNSQYIFIQYPMLHKSCNFNCFNMCYTQPSCSIKVLTHEHRLFEHSLWIVLKMQPLTGPQGKSLLLVPHNIVLLSCGGARSYHKTFIYLLLVSHLCSSVECNSQKSQYFLTFDHIWMKRVNKNQC